MRTTLLPTLALLLGAGILPAAEPLPAGPLAIPGDHLVATPPPEELPAEADLVPWPQAAYPRTAAGSAADARGWLMDAPAGKHGWVKAGPDGRLAFADGTPARFWGTTLTYAGSFPDGAEDIERVADALAAAGYNLVRFHHNDMPRAGLGYLRNKQQGAPETAIELDPAGIDRFDRIAAACIKRGIYIHLDLVDQRPWTADTGMPGWEDLVKAHNHLGWKGVWPHPAMVEAWKRAATALLSHQNPYTGRTWGEEPGVALVEAINENGPFWDWSFTVTDAVRAWHVADWNRWLAERYGSREALARRWTDATGTAGLHADEDPAKGTVHRPALGPVQEWDRGNGSKARGPCRLNDFYAYLGDCTERLHRTTAAHIRSHGFQGLVIGSHELQGPINQLAEVRATGTISAHLYANPRLAWGARPGVKGITLDGVDVKSNNWFSNLPRIKVAGAPSWNGEWTGGSWTRRADVNLGVAAAHAFQRVDGGAQFGFIQRWVGEAMPDYDWTYRYIGYLKRIDQGYSIGQDPSWTAVNRVAAALVQRGDLPRARYKVHLALSAEDVHEQNLHAAGINGGGGTVGGASLFLPLLHEVETAFFDTAYQGDAEVVFSTGRSASGDYRDARHAVVLGHNPWCDRYRQKRDLAAPARLLQPSLEVADLAQPTVFTVAWPYPAERTLTLARTEAALAIASLPAGAQPIGRSADGRWTLGWCDQRRLVLPNAAAFGDAVGDARWLYRLYLAAAARWGLDLAGNSADAPAYISDNRALVTDWATGSQLVDSPRTQIIAGFVGYRAANATANLAVSVEQTYAAVAATSLDGQPIAAARRVLVVAAGRVANTGAVIAPGKDGKPALLDAGRKVTRAEALRGRLRLTGLTGGARQVFALDPEGRRLGEVPAEQQDGALTIALSPRWRTLWFEVCAPGTEGPAAPAAPAGAPWPAPESAPAAAAPAPATLPVARFLAMVGRPVVAEEPAPALDADGLARLALTDPATWKPFQAYGNLKAEIAQREGAAVLKLAIGKHTKDWHGGTWSDVAPLAGLKAEDAVALAFGFQGDGTMPRESHVTLKTRDGAQWKSRDLGKEFENPAWHQVVLRASDFAAVGKGAASAGSLNLAATARIDLTCIGPLFDSRSNATLGGFALLIRGVAEVKAERLAGALPPVAPLAAPALELPLVADAAITPDGDPSEPAWARAVGFAVDESAVPAWHPIGSFIAEGSRKHGELARCWLLATPAGLALAVEVDKGVGAPVAGPGDWWKGDCVELFSDARLERKKPSKQLFLAYRRPGLDRAACSAPGAGIGRLRTRMGYALEALIPWGELGLPGVPEAAFGLDLQIDIADADGRRLQLTYATGTNEAWITAGRYLTVQVKR